MTRRQLKAPASGFVVAAGCLLLALVATHTSPRGYHANGQSTGDYRLGSSKQLRGSIVPGDRRAVGGQHGGSSLGVPSLLVLLILVALAFAILLRRWLHQRGDADRRRVPAGPVRAAPGSLGAPADRLAEAVIDSLAELERWPVRDAIIACWVRLEATTDAMGLHSPASDTPDDFIRRVIDAAGVRPELLDQLAWLYREARFSMHAMTDVDRANARRALEAIQADLGKLSYA